MGLEWIIGTIATVIVTPVLMVYKEPRLYDEFIRPIMKVLFIGMFFAVGGAFIGQMLAENTLLPYVIPSKIEEVKKSLSELKNLYAVIGVVSPFIVAYETFLMVVARKSVDWKEEDKSSKKERDEH